MLYMSFHVKLFISVSAYFSKIKRRVLDEQAKRCKKIFGRASPSPKPIVLVEITRQRQYIGADKQGGLNLQDEYSNIWGLQVIQMRQYIDGVIAERNIFTPLCIFFQLQQGETKIDFLLKILLVQIANKLRSPQCRSEVQ